MGMGSGGSRWVGSRSHNAKMRILVCCVMIAIGVLPMPPLKIMARAASLPAGLHYRAAFEWRSGQLSARSRRSAAPAAPAALVGAPFGPQLGAPFGVTALVGPWRKSDVVAAEAGDSATTTPAAASSSSPEETTTEEPYESGDEGSDFGSDILNTLLEVVGTLLSFFSDPPGAIQKMVDQAKQLMGGARSLMATGPAGARQARIMLTEAQRILETARGIMETTGRITNTARNVAQSIARPWTG